MSTSSPLLTPSEGTSGLRNRLAKIKSPYISVIHGSKDKSDEEDNEVLMQSFTSASSRASSEEIEVEMDKGTLGGEDERDHGKGIGERGPERRPLLRQLSGQSSMNRKPPLRRSRTRNGRNIYAERDRSSSASGWLGLDLSIIVALVSPLGNLLTGGDHIKNVLLILLLVYYLHQLVEVPWSLYKASLTEPSAAARLKAHAAHSELRSLEVFYLVLTVLSPFLGASLLRVVATSITGNPETLSWFSTGLFVLATGLRPWSHLVQRLKDRSHALQELVSQRAAEIEEEEMEDDHGQDVNTQLADAMQGEIDGLNKHIATLNSRVSELSKKNHHEWTDLAEHVSEVIESVEDALRRHRTAITRANQTNDARFAAFEARFDALDAVLVEKSKATNGVLIFKAENTPRPYLRGDQLRDFAWEFMALPWTIAALCWIYIGWILPRFGRGRPSLKSEGKKREINSPTPPSRRHSALESIPEEDISNLAQADSDRTLVCEPLEPAANSNTVVTSLLWLLFSPIHLFSRMLYLFLNIPQTIIRSVHA